MWSLEAASNTEVVQGEDGNGTKKWPLKEASNQKAVQNLRVEVGNAQPLQMFSASRTAPEYQAR